MTSAAARHPDDEHDWLSAAYVDEWVAEWSDRVDRPSELRRVAAAIPIERSEAQTVLDVGGGWGPLTEEVLASRPHATITLVDFSPPMLDHARRRLAGFGDRVRCEQRDLADEAWARGLGGPFDAVVSSLAIHNLRDPGLVRRVYADIQRLLRPGHWFFNLEVAFPSGPAADVVIQRLRAHERGDDPDAVGGPLLAPDTSNESRPLSVAHQLTLLQAAGFEEVDCLWRSGWTALLAARAANANAG